MYLQQLRPVLLLLPAAPDWITTTPPATGIYQPPYTPLPTAQSLRLLRCCEDVCASDHANHARIRVHNGDAVHLVLQHQRSSICSRGSAQRQHHSITRLHWHVKVQQLCSTYCICTNRTPACCHAATRPCWQPHVGMKWYTKVAQLNAHSSKHAAHP